MRGLAERLLECAAKMAEAELCFACQFVQADAAFEVLSQIAVDFALLPRCETAARRVASTFSDDARRLRNPKAILSALSGFASNATRMSSHMRSNSEEGELMMLDSRALWAGISEQVVCSDMDVPSEEACFNRNKSPRPTPPPHRTNVRRQCGRVMQDLSDFWAVT